MRFTPAICFIVITPKKRMFLITFIWRFSQRKDVERDQTSNKCRKNWPGRGVHDLNQLLYKSVDNHLLVVAIAKFISIIKEHVHWNKKTTTLRDKTFKNLDKFILFPFLYTLRCFWNKEYFVKWKTEGIYDHLWPLIFLVCKISRKNLKCFLEHIFK